MNIYVVLSRRDDRVIGVYSTLERAQAEGAQYTEELQARKGVAVKWEMYAGATQPRRSWLDNVPYDGEEYEVSIEEWDLDQ